jgi:hypothetical protein
LVEYEFIEIIYILVIKKLSSHKETEETKAKYQAVVDKLVGPIQGKMQKEEEEKEYNS